MLNFIATSAVKDRTTVKIRQMFDKHKRTKTLSSKKHTGKVHSDLEGGTLSWKPLWMAL